MTEVPKHEPTPQELDPLRPETYGAISKKCLRLTSAMGRPLHGGDEEASWLETSFGKKIFDKIRIGNVLPFSFPVEGTPLLTKGGVAMLGEVPSEKSELIVIHLETFPQGAYEKGLTLFLERDIEVTRDGNIGVRVPEVYQSDDDTVNAMLWEDNERWGLPYTPGTTFIDTVDGEDVEYEPDRLLRKIMLTNTQGIQLLTRLHELGNMLSDSEEDE